MKSIHKNKRAFTLIELLVVIAIIAILAAILFPVFAQAKLAAKKASSVSNIKNIELGLLMYTNDYDDFFSNSEWGSGNSNNTPVYSNWATDNYPYIKNGTNHIEKGNLNENNGGDGIFHDTAAPSVSEADTGVDTQYSSSPNPTYQWGFGYGVNENIMVHNDYSLNPAYLSSGQLATSLATTALPTPSDTILVMTKGVENTTVNSGDDQAAYTYPYIVTAQWEYMGAVTDGNGNVIRDGDESATTAPGVTLPDGFTGNANYDTDCASASCHNAWENVGHPRYRYTNTGIAGFVDGHVKTMTKGSLKWYKNLWASNPGIPGNGYGQWGGASYGVDPY